jgi:DNA invertase Pin-like site-specific DNA recombinase
MGVMIFLSNRKIRKFGYARVSSRDQNLARQIAALKEVGIEKKNIFTDRQSGKNFDRPGYKKLLRTLKKQDELYIKSIDRLGRNYDEILEQWRFLTKVKEVKMIVIDFPLLDTRRSTGGVTGEFISDLVLQILSYVAQVERENTRQRQMEGIREARKRGVRFGRPRIPIPDEFELVADEVRQRKISLREGAGRLGVSHTTLRNWMKERESTGA